MATTCRNLQTKALGKLGIVRAGGDPTASDAAVVMDSLKSLYMEQITGGGLGRVYNVVASAAGTLTGGEGNQHFNITTEDAVTIDLPATVPWGYWWNWKPCRDYGWGLSVPLGSDASATVPRDKAVAMVTDQYGDTRATYIYDGTVQRWMRVDNLTDNDEAPLSARDPDGLAALLATRVADEFGTTTLSPLTMRAANRYKTAMVTNYGNAEADDCYH